MRNAVTDVLQSRIAIVETNKIFVIAVVKRDIDKLSAAIQ